MVQVLASAVLNSGIKTVAPTPSNSLLWLNQWAPSFFLMVYPLSKRTVMYAIYVNYIQVLLY